LDLSGNKLKDLQSALALINKLPNLQMFCIDKNPCWPEDKDRDLRVTACSAISQLDHLGATFKYLNGYEIRPAERCRALLENKIFDEVGVEKFRVELIWEKLNPPKETESLNLSSYDMKSMRDVAGRLLQLPNLKHLDLSNNKLSSLEELKKLLDNCLKLVYLDVRENNFEKDYRELIAVIRPLCPGLKALFLQRSSKSAANPKDYVAYVFSQMPALDLVDNLPPPDSQIEGGGRRKTKSVFDVFQGPNPFAVPPPSAPFTNGGGSPPGGVLVMQPNFAPTAPPTSASAPPVEEPAYSPQATNESFYLYPDLGGGFSAESYLPQDYHQTVGKKYDLSALAAALQEEREQRELAGQLDDED